MIASISGIRGVLNQDLSLEDVVRLARNFVALTGSHTFLLGRDTRSTGEVIGKSVASAMLAAGSKVVDMGILSTPALFRESLKREVPAVMVTASHNEPPSNGLKFIIGGKGIGAADLAAILGDKTKSQAYAAGSITRSTRTSYDEELVEGFGRGAFAGVKVALDLGGGAAIFHAPRILRELGCQVFTINDTPGVFTRTIDPVADDLALLQKVVRQKACDIGLAFDCDGDRLVIVDNEGKKRSGDFMLTMALKQILSPSGDKNVVVSVDTTLAVDEAVKGVKGQVYRSKVGEANVVAKMIEKGVRLGGEGSSGGLIDGGFNYCRDSMVAALTIIRGIKNLGERAFLDTKNYSQTRLSIRMPKAKAARVMKELQKQYKNAETTDGVKVRLSSKSWVLVRASGTEDVVRVSAEAPTAKESEKIAETFLRRLKELTR